MFQKILKKILDVGNVEKIPSMTLLVKYDSLYDTQIFCLPYMTLGINFVPYMTL
jgi:hypothetical protein